MGNLDNCLEITQYDGHDVYQAAKHNVLLWAVPWLRCLAATS